MSTPINDANDQLLKQTLRMTAILVGSLVVFVGVLSLLAVLVTSKAVGTSPKADNTDQAAKKPLSI